MAAKQPITRGMIARLALGYFTRLPWQMRGSSPFTGHARFMCPFDHLMGEIDDFADWYVAPAILRALGTRCAPVVPVGWDEDMMGFDGTGLHMFSRVDHIRQSVLFVLNFDYKPPIPDHRMPVYFWLGEQSDVR